MASLTSKYVYAIFVQKVKNKYAPVDLRR